MNALKARDVAAYISMFPAGNSGLMQRLNPSWNKATETDSVRARYQEELIRWELEYAMVKYMQALNEQMEDMGIDPANLICQACMVEKYDDWPALDTAIQQTFKGINFYSAYVLVEDSRDNQSYILKITDILEYKGVYATCFGIKDIRKAGSVREYKAQAISPDEDMPYMVAGSRMVQAAQEIGTQPSAGHHIPDTVYITDKKYAGTIGADSAVLSYHQEGEEMTDWQASWGNNHKSIRYGDHHDTDFLILETPYTASWQIKITDEAVSGTRTTAQGQQQRVQLHRVRKK